MVELPNPPDLDQPIVRPSDGRADPDWFRWFILFAALCRQLLDTISGGLDEKAGLDQKWSIGFQVAKVTTNPITAILKSDKARVVTSVVTKSRTGTCTLTGKIDGTNLGGTANSVSTTEQERAHTTNNSVAVGQDLVFTPSSVSSCEDMIVMVRGTYNLDA